ncbi:GrpB family protein [Paenibacillus sp. D51F]
MQAAKGLGYPAALGFIRSDGLSRTLGVERGQSRHIYSRRWNGNLRFRDCLRSDPDLLAQYAGLKAELASRYRDDRAAYTVHKGLFITAVMESAGRQNQGKEAQA